MAIKVVSNAGPLMVFSKLNLLHLLKELYGRVEFPLSVYRETVSVGIRRGFTDAQLLNSFLIQNEWDPIKAGAREHFIAWYKKQIKRQLEEHIPRYGNRIGVKVKDIRILDLGHRWASCGRNGIINFNWRSVMAPIWVFDYILVHEMVHLIERTHSDRFWQLVSRIMPDFEKYARWLNENGADLDL
ncbi:MAG: M48 family metallopeptidase [Thermodesulfobacteriota bacterium]|nr:M48 family metallopeptidase [Thermodesulfobacteriota bacterium]